MTAISMDKIWKDLRYGIRLLAKRPLFTFTAVFTLALGIGANATIFNLVNAVLLRPLPVQDPGRLARIYGIQAGHQGGISFPDFEDYRNHSRVLSGLTATRLVTISLQRSEGSDQLLGEVVSANYFSVLGVPAEKGRMFYADNDNVETGQAAVISYGLWQRQFGKDADILGKAVNMNGNIFTITGIAGKAFKGTFAGAFTDVWIPIRDAAWLGTEWRQKRDMPVLQIIGRMKGDTNLAKAAAELSTISTRLEKSYPDTNRGKSIKLGPATLLHGNLRKGISMFLTIVMAIVGFVLLTACANIASLLLISTAGRRREIAVRLALGASRFALLRQFLVETTLLSLLGGAAALFLSIWCSELLLRFNPIPSIPLRFDFGLDYRLASYTFLISIFSGIFLGLAPSMPFLKSDLIHGLKNESGMSTRGYQGSRLRNIFVISQVALSLILLIGAGLFLQSLNRAASVELGFDPNHGLAMDLDLKSLGYSDQKGMQLYDQILNRMNRVPGIQTASLANLAPLDFSTPHTGILVDGYQPESGANSIPVSYNRVSPGYFQTLKISLKGGRDFTERDRADSPGVVIINETMANRFWPNQEVIGKQFRLEGKASAAILPKTVTVVGIAQNVKYRTLGEAPEAHLYFPFAQHYDPEMTLLVRTTTDPENMLQTVQRELQSVHGSIQGFFARTLLQHAAFSLLPARMAATLSSIFGAMALLLASVGIFGAVGYSVAQRTREIGIRMALGAQPQDILNLVIRYGVQIVAAGILIGVFASVGLTRFASTLLYGIDPVDPLTFLSVSSLLLLVALLACYLPARKAMRVEPTIALKYE